MERALCHGGGWLVSMQHFCLHDCAAFAILYVWVSGFKYMIFLGVGFLRYGHISSRQPKTFFVAIVFLSLKNAIETIFFFFKPAHLRKVSCTRN